MTVLAGCRCINRITSHITRYTPEEACQAAKAGRLLGFGYARYLSQYGACLRLRGADRTGGPAEAGPGHLTSVLVQEALAQWLAEAR
jgi:hypothetical protein